MEKETKKRNWIVARKSDRIIEWDNIHSNTTVTLGMIGKTDNYVSILGRGRRQHEYLCGGNSMIHDASKSKAEKLARAWMLLHPRG